MIKREDQNAVNLFLVDLGFVLQVKKDYFYWIKEEEELKFSLHRSITIPLDQYLLCLFYKTSLIATFESLDRVSESRIYYCLNSLKFFKEDFPNKYFQYRRF
jgi:hypothetical protein